MNPIPVGVITVSDRAAQGAGVVNLVKVTGQSRLFIGNLYGFPRLGRFGLALFHERAEIRLPVGRIDSTVDRKNRPVNKEGVLTCQECNHPRDIMRCGCPAEGKAFPKSRHYGFILFNFGSGIG
jgi:hypothetical protein